MLPSISRNPILESSLKNSSVDLKSRTLKQHLFTPTEFQVPHFHQHQNQNLSHSQHQTIHQPALIQQKRLTATEKREEKTLDGFSLLENVGMALPDDAIFGVLCDKKYTTVVESDFVFFVQLMYLDVSENYLQLSHFGNLPRLQELRLACNEIRDIQRDDLVNFSLGDRFLSLQNLDLSYNSLTVTSIHSLGCLPYLRELNLCGNQLSELPDMSTFYCLEKLLLENNKFERAQVFHNLSVIPNLREVSLAYNYLSEIPKSSCRLGKFKVLETLDVAFNYFGSDTSVDGILDLVRLRTLFLYGNPVLGPTGEDPHFIYVEDLALAAIESRGGGGEAYRSSYPIEIITEIPRKRSFKKGEDLGRRLLSYKNFQMAVAKRTDADRIGGKSARDWIKEGNNTLFAQAVALAQSQLEEGQRRGLYTPPEGPPLVVADYELTFLTRALEVDTQDEVVAHQSGSGGGSGREDRQGRSGSGARQRDREREKEREKGRESKFRVSGRDRGRDQMADRVMCQVAEECGLVPSSSDHREGSRGDIVVEREREGGRVGSSGSQGSNGLGLGLGLGQGQGLTSNAHSHSLNRSSSDLVLLKNRVVIAKTVAMRQREDEIGGGRERDVRSDEDYYDDDGNDRGVVKKKKNTSVPDHLLRRSMTESMPLNAHPLALSTAITALRFAIRHPLTNYSEIPAKSFMSAQDHQSSTAASTNRKTFTKAHFKALTEETTAANGNILVKERVRESRPGSPTQEGYGTGSSFAYHKTGASASARISGSKANKSNTQHHKAKQFTTLQHIDDILDDLNFSSREMATERLSSTLPARKLNSQGNGNGNGNGNGRGKGIGAGGGVDVSGVKDELTYKGRQGLRKGNSSSTGISNLIQMVDEVVSKLS